MKRRIIHLLMGLLISFFTFSQTIELSGSNNTSSGNQSQYFVILTGYSSSTSFQIECSEHGQLVDFNNSTRGSINLNNNSNYVINVKWGNVEATNAYVKIYETYDPFKKAEVAPIKITKSTAIIWSVNAPSSASQYQVINVQLRINGEALSNYDYINISPDFYVLVGDKNANQQGYFSTTGNHTLTYKFKKKHGSDIEKIVSTNVSIMPAPPVISIEGPSSFGVGSMVTFTGYFPRFPSPSVVGEMQITPSNGVSVISNTGRSIIGRFTQRGSYHVTFTARDTETGLTTYETKYIVVDNTPPIKLSLSLNNIANIEIPEKILKQKPIYEVYNQFTGIKVKGGFLNNIYEYIDLNNIGKGPHIIIIKTKDNSISFKIMVK